MAGKYLFLFLIFLVIQKAWSCSGGIGDDGRIFTNPTLSWTMSPPAAWTYPVTYAQQTGQFFPGQPLTQQDALIQAQGDIQAAVISALSQNNIPTQGVRVTTGYTPQEISNCQTVAGTAPLPTMTMANTDFGLLESGAITMIITPAAAVPVAMCATKTFGTYTQRTNIVNANAQIEGVTISGLMLRQVTNSLQSALSFNYHVRFQTEITYS
ncbi:unnamed protein product [Bursaphelenchus xylophilus]|uniref:(pine wood nematode) hypothetical protein n=1 Tax=Bursaphelenchus xylophilus TaxID=6326 RepID=A0A1I7RM78_BURXY|nr:unnamed protein product [Bursaphelenchus xylophilus]CAG9118274.1 unnamed protein product [Bursaphelenchus xylophilus]